MKFSDVILAVATMFVIFIFLDCLFNFALIPANTSFGEVAVMVSVLIASLIVGYVFAGKIQEESRMTSIGKIIILKAVMMVMTVLMVYAVVPDFKTVLTDTLNSIYGTSTTGLWTNTDWFAHELMLLVMQLALFAVYALVFGFIGLYLGSMRKPSTKTKE